MTGPGKAHVWMYWEDVPGEHKAPYLELCLETIKLHLDEDMCLHALDEEGVFEWLPDLSPEVWEKLGTPVRRADYARVRLVERHGGLWLDADCIAMAPLRPLLEPLGPHEVVGWGSDLGGRFYNNLFAASPGAPLLRGWIEAQDAALAAQEDWRLLSWAALGQDLMRDLVTAHGCHALPSERIAPVLWYEWRRLLSPLQSPARVLASEPITVMLWNREMGRHLARRSADSLLAGRMLIGRLLRIALGISSLAEELDLVTRLSLLSDLRYTTSGRRIEHHVRALGELHREAPRRPEKARAPRPGGSRPENSRPDPVLALARPSGSSMTVPPAVSPPVAAVVVTHRRPRLATEVVRNLVEVERLPPERIVLVVNGEGGLEDPGLQAAVRVVALAENLGPAGGFREGMAVACSLPEVEWLYLCEDDVLLFDLPSPRVESLVRAGERLDANGAGPVGAIVAYGRDLHHRTGHTTIHEVDGAVGFDEVDVASWGASLVSRSVLDAGVLPDDGYFFGYEDFDFWFQVKEAGFRILLDRASAFRVASQMSLRGRDQALEGERPADSDEPWRAFYVSRNYFRLARRHGSPTWVVAHLAYSARRLQLASSQAERSAIVHGLMAGLRGATGKDARYVRTLGEIAASGETGGAGPQLAGRAEIGTARRRVLHVLPCDVARGVQVFARELRAALDGGSDEHRILTLFRAPPAALQADYCLEVPMGRLRSLGFDPRVVIRLRRVFDALRPDVVVAHGGEPLKYLAWVDRGDAPLVYLSIGTATEAARRGARRLLYRALLSRADFVAGVSAETLDEAERDFGVRPSRIVLLPNGRDPRVFRPREQATPRKGPVEVVFVGHLTATKRPLRFLAAVDTLRRRGHDVRGVVVGDGPLEEEVRRAAATSGGVEVLGRRDDVPALLRAADILAFTSVPEGEGMPGVLIEAALSGLPAVATAVPGASTVVVDGVTGFVVPPDDDEAFLEALEQLVSNDKLRRAMGAAARERAEAAFSLEKSARSWQAFLDRIAPDDRTAKDGGTVGGALGGGRGMGDFLP